MGCDGWMGGCWALRRLVGAIPAGLGDSGASNGMGVCMLERVVGRAWRARWERVGFESYQ